MSSAEPARHSLYSRLEDVLGEQHAETLMTYLLGRSGVHYGPRFGAIWFAVDDCEDLQVPLLDLK